MFSYVLWLIFSFVSSDCRETSQISGILTVVFKCQHKTLSNLSQLLLHINCHWAKCKTMLVTSSKSGQNPLDKLRWGSKRVSIRSVLQSCKWVTTCKKTSGFQILGRLGSMRPLFSSLLNLFISFILSQQWRNLFNITLLGVMSYREVC